MEMENALVRSGLTIERADAHRGHYTFEEPEALLRYAARMPWLPTPHPDAPGLEDALARLAARFDLRDEDLEHLRRIREARQRPGGE